MEGPQIDLPVPPSAKTERARQFWENKNPLTNIRKALRPTEEDLDEWIMILLESFSTSEMAYCIANYYDMLPVLAQRSLIEERWYGKLVKVLVKLHWQRLILRYLGHYPNMMGVLERRDPAKASLLRTKEGMIWWSWFAYRTMVYLRYHAGIEGGGKILPPPGVCPLRPLPHREHYGPLTLPPELKDIR